MATSPTSKSALKSGAAKDDAVGQDGDFTFTIQDLLANDPGGAAKVSVDKQFFFGDTAADQADQGGYMASHGIVMNADGTFTITDAAIDFNYFVQIGNKGTWSTAHVDVTAPEPTPEPEPHAGDVLFTENFEGYTIEDDHGGWGVVNLGYGGWANPQGSGAPGEIVQGSAFPESIQPTSGDHWLDTQNSPGGIDITNWFNDPTGGAFRVSFDLGVHDFGEGPLQETNHDAVFQLKVDGVVVETFSYEQLSKPEQMQHFDVVVDSGGDGVAQAHTFSFVDATQSEGNYVGFALDTIQVHDWII
jgi:hypothetical protein